MTFPQRSLPPYCINWSSHKPFQTPGEGCEPPLNEECAKEDTVMFYIRHIHIPRTSLQAPPGCAQAKWGHKPKKSNKWDLKRVVPTKRVVISPRGNLLWTKRAFTPGGRNRTEMTKEMKRAMETIEYEEELSIWVESITQVTTLGSYHHNKETKTQCKWTETSL